LTTSEICIIVLSCIYVEGFIRGLGRCNKHMSSIRWIVFLGESTYLGKIMVGF
jgi:hypothetical protein